MRFWKEISALLTVPAKNLTDFYPLAEVFKIVLCREILIVMDWMEIFLGLYIFFLIKLSEELILQFYE